MNDTRREHVTREIVLICLLLIIAAVAALLINLTFRTDSQAPDVTSSNLRDRAMSMSRLFGERAFPEVGLIDAVTAEISEFPSGLKVVILLSNIGCNPCQNRELRLVQDIHDRFSGRLAVIGIYHNPAVVDGDVNRQATLLLRKITKVTFPMTVSDTEALSTFMSGGRYPLVLLLDGDTILFNYFPIPEDDEFSNTQVEKLSMILKEQLSEIN